MDAYNATQQKLRVINVKRLVGAAIFVCFVVELLAALRTERNAPQLFAVEIADQ